MKRYVILAGVNGAGKSTLFSILTSLSEIEKINLDEIVREIGDWRDIHAVVEAGKIVIRRMNNSKGQSHPQCRISFYCPQGVSDILPG